MMIALGVRALMLLVYLLVSAVLVCITSAQIPTARAEFSDSADQVILLVRGRDRVQMSCRILHLPETDAMVAVHWMRIDEDGSSGIPSNIVFTGALNQSLVIQAFSPRYDTGNYSCVSSTKNGNSYSSNQLQLRSRTVKIFAVRNPVEVLRHSRVELNCIVRSPPGEEYRTQWHKGLLLLKSEVEGYAPLVLQNVSQSDEGTYDCTVFSTDNDNDDEDDFDLVIVDLPVFSSVPSNRELEKLTALSLSCTTVSAGTTFFSWHFNGAAIAPSQISTTSQSSTLMISSLTFEDQGNYSCSASNLAGTSIQTNEVLIVGAPDIRSRGGRLEEIVHTTVVLDCQSVARPPVQYTRWMKDGELLSSDLQHRIFTNESLLLYNVTEETSGNYTCTVGNGRGTPSITYDLTVLGFPRPPSNFTHTISSQDIRSVLLSWTIPDIAPGQTLDGFQLELWANQNNPQHMQTLDIPPNTSSKALDNLFPGERYYAQLHSYNRAGVSPPLTTSFLLPITAPKLDLDITALPGGRSLAVQWTLVYDGGPDVEVFTFEVYIGEGFKVMVDTVSPRLEAGEHLITGLQPTTQYMVCVTIGNSVQETTLNHIINTTAAPPSRPSSLDISSVTTRHVQLSFSILEGSESVSHFLLNITTNGGAEPSQKVIARDDQEQVESTASVNRQLLVELVVLELRPFTTYSFQVAAVSDVGTGEYSSATKPVQLEDGRIIYFTVVGVVGGVALVVGAVITTIAVMVWRSKASQKRKRTFSITTGAAANHPQTSFVLQSPPYGKKDRGGTPGSRGLHSPTGSSMHDVPSVLVMDVNQQTDGQQANHTPSYEKLNSSRTRPDSLAGDSCSSVGMVEKRPSISHSEPGAALFKPSPASNLHQSQLHSSTGRMPLSTLNPLYPRHQLLTEHRSSSGQNIYVQISPQEQEHKSLGMAHTGHAPLLAHTGHTPLLAHTGHTPLPAHTGHTPLLHQNSVQHCSVHQLSLPPSNALSSSAPMINVRLSRESILEILHPTCMTDV